MPTTTSVQRRDYTAKDYDSVKARLQTHLQENFPVLFNDLYQDGLGVLVLELAAKLGDQLAFAFDFNFNEAFFDTVLQRNNMRSLCKLIGYDITGYSAASATVRGTVTGSDTPSYPIAIARGQSFAVGAQTFTVMEDYSFDVTDTIEMTVYEGELTQDIFTSTGLQYQQYKSTSSQVATNSETAVQPVISVGAVDWTRVTTLWSQGVGNYYELSWSAELGFKVDFGEGVHGNIPVVGAQVELEYLNTSGTSGNLVQASITGSVVATDMASDEFTVTLAATENAAGGANEETVIEARRNAPAFIRSQDRIVSEDDITGYAESDPGIMKAAILSADPFSYIYVYCLGSNYTVPTQSLLTSLETDMNDMAMTGIMLYLRACSLVYIDFTCTVYCDSNYLTADVQSSVETALTDLFQPTDDDQATRDLGENVRVSDIVHTIESTTGVSYVNFVAATFLAGRDADGVALPKDSFGNVTVTALQYALIGTFTGISYIRDT